MIKLPQLIEDRLTERAKRAVYAAILKHGSSPLNLFYALTAEKGSLARNILLGHSLPSPKNFSRKLKRDPSIEDVDNDIRQILKRAARKAAGQNQPYIGTEHLLYALLNPPYSDIKKALPNKKISRLKKYLNEFFSQSVKLPAKSRAQHQRNSKITALGAFSQNLTQLAEQGKIDPVSGREKETERICQILSRRSKNNPLLIGEPGIGKTAIVQGLAQKINNGEVPAGLLHKKIFALNLNSLIAGTVFRGDFEIRMQEIIKEASQSDVILFIDEIHTLIGAGSAMGSLDAANILKPALASGSFSCIGATTLDEYKKYLEKDRALERRFQPIIIEEENEDQAIKTLFNLRKLYEKHHGIIIEDEAIVQAVRLSARYMHDRFLPDKAIDLLDEAASMVKNSFSRRDETKALKQLEKQKFFLTSQKEEAIAREQYRDAIFFKDKEARASEEINSFMRHALQAFAKPTLKKEHITQTLFKMCGIPVEESQKDFSAAKKLEQEIAREIIGQKEAIAEITRVLSLKSAGLAPENRPLGSFLLLGPSGVGKTALAKMLAEKTSRTLILINMAEYAEPHTISRLIGSPPGYVGYGEGGELTEKIRRSPYAVVLFDEIEKAHGQVHNILLSILEDGSLQDSLGRKASFKNAIIFLTSNAYAENESGKVPLGLLKIEEPAQYSAKYTEGMREMLRPEIINRIDRVVVFNKLGENEIKKICELFINKLEQRLSGLTLNVHPEVINYLAREAQDTGEGAREARSAVLRFVEHPLAEYLIQNPGSKKAKFVLKKGKILVV